MTHSVFVAVLLFLIVGALPRWSHSRDWGYYPSGTLLAILALILLLR
ncbi:DUF3309 family protein [Pelagicoccus enzymogenes]|nr:DUF3309 family protein [Pelagicoccus enzymogenes]MDQ8198433.1 DUF3309 family protein [Pelagicoccus enzymogenes]